MCLYTIGLDLGGTHLRIHLQKEDGHVLLKHKYTLTQKRWQNVLELIASQIHRLCTEYRIPFKELSIGFALAAMLDSTGQNVLLAPNLGWKNVDLVRQFSIYGLPQPILLNDVDAATYGEYMQGAGRGASQLACVVVGSGVGCGLVLNQQLYTGSRRVAAEFGHMKTMHPDKQRCGCGQLNCIEAYAGGHHLTRRLQEAAQSNTSTYLRTIREQHGLDGFSPAHLEEGQALGDQICLHLAEQAARALGMGLANLVTLLNPSHLLLGGSVLRHSPLLYQRILDVMLPQINEPAKPSLHVGPLQLGDDAGAIGAALWAQQRTNS